MSTPDQGLVSSLLREYGEATRALLFQYLPSAEPRRYLYDLAADYPRRGGRAFRPSLCIATARAFGAPMELALRSAVSLVLALTLVPADPFHGFTTPGVMVFVHYVAAPALLALLVVAARIVWSRRYPERDGAIDAAV